MGSGAAGGLRHHKQYLGRHLGFYQELEIRLKPQKMVLFLCLTCKITQISIFHHFIHNLYLSLFKEVEKHVFSFKNGLTTCYL